MRKQERQRYGYGEWENVLKGERSVEGRNSDDKETEISI